MCEEIRDASRTDESHQISSWSEQSGGVITLRNGYEGCCSFQEVNWVSNVCFCDAMLQHSEAILCPVHKVTKDRGGGWQKQLDYHSAKKKRAVESGGFTCWVSLAGEKQDCMLRTQMHVHFGCTGACAGLTFITYADGVCLTDTKLAEPYF